MDEYIALIIIAYWEHVNAVPGSGALPLARSCGEINNQEVEIACGTQSQPDATSGLRDYGGRGYAFQSSAT